MRGGGLQQAAHGDKWKTTTHDVVKCRKSCMHLIHGILGYVQFQGTSSHLPQEICQEGEEGLCSS